MRVVCVSRCASVCVCVSRCADKLIVINNEYMQEEIMIRERNLRNLRGNEMIQGR